MNLIKYYKNWGCRKSRQPQFSIHNSAFSIYLNAFSLNPLPLRAKSFM